MNTIETLRNYVLVDGFHIVVDVEKSHGSWIVDQNTQKRYLDCYSQFASQPFGWGHPSLALNSWKFAKFAQTKIANSDMYTEIYAEFAESFHTVTLDFKHYFFIEGGGLAVENALKTAFDWKSRKTPMSNAQLDVIHLKDAFHGRTGYTLSLTNTGALKTQYFPKFPWTRILNPKITMDEEEVKRAEEASLEHAEEVLKRGKVAAIITEPIQGEGGDNHFRPEYLKGLRYLADKYEALLIYDEVQTGFGLTGEWWCYQALNKEIEGNLKPDILCFGKKTQVCGIAVTEKIDKLKDNVFQTSGRINSTWGGNIVDMLRAKIIMKTMHEEHLVENSRNVGAYFLKRLQKLSEVYPQMMNVRGRGLMISFDLSSSEERNKLVSTLLTEGMLALKCGKNTIRFRPHLTFSKEDVNTAIGYIQGALSN